MPLPQRPTILDLPASTPVVVGATSSRNEAHDRRTDFCGDRCRQVAPDPRTPPECPVIRGRRGCSDRGGEAIPPKRFFPSAPLQFEAMGAGARRTPPEVEARQSFTNRPLHARPIQQHVGRCPIERAKRRSPRHLELITKAESAAGGNRAAVDVSAREPRVVRKLPRDLLKKSERLGRRPQIAHVLREHPEKRRDLIATEPDRGSGFQRSPNLTAKFRVEAVEQLLRRGRQVENNRDLPVRSTERCLYSSSIPEFEQLDLFPLRKRDSRIDERANPFLCSQWPTVIQKRHRHEIVPEHDATHAHERKHSNQISFDVTGCEVNAVMAKYLVDQSAPAKLVKMSVPRLFARKLIPFRLIPLVTRDGNCHAAPDLTSGVAAHSRDGMYDPIAPKLNSPSSRSIRGSVSPSPR